VTTKEKVMRKQEEIAEKCKTFGESLIGSMVVSDLLVYLDFEHAKEFLKEGITAADWNGDGDEDAIGRQYTRENVLKEMADYVCFAFEKMDGQRGISSARAIAHYQCWLFLLGEEDEHAARLIELAEYVDGYGQGFMHEVCDAYGFVKPEWTGE
jgi:hypothetical protein